MTRAAAAKLNGHAHLSRSPSRKSRRVAQPKSESPPETDSARIYIRQAAEMVGATAVALRIWEQQQLIAPKRTASGYRSYSMADVRRMQRIQTLMRSGVNAAGVRRILDAEPSPAETSNKTVAPSNKNIGAGVVPPRSVGQKIRGLRKGRAMTLRDLSALTGLSASYLSSVERGLASPSIASLQKLGAAFNTNALALMSDLYEAPDVPVVRKDARHVLDNEKGVQIEDLSTAGSNLEPLLFTFQPGCGSDGAITHEGEEFLYVMSGRLEIQLDGATDYILDPGDSMSFRSERPHQFGGAGPEPAVVLWINTPRTF